ncbi:hypothetical protein RJ640_024988 [Escallonia rubra]|uniref:Uncharacterized protein n=1 Tax=Escallonia rubra TaxID=112253 RepID=A0AA88QZX8_9ASTE|nr:hypothetical protein RJ640_024988 [Escallonia rubra]
MVARGVAHLMWNEGWPQPGEREKGKGGVDAKGGHGDGGVEQVCPVVPVANISKRTAAAKCGGGRGGMGKWRIRTHSPNDALTTLGGLLGDRVGQSVGLEGELHTVPPCVGDVEVYVVNDMPVFPPQSQVMAFDQSIVLVRSNRSKFDGTSMLKAVKKPSSGDNPPLPSVAKLAKILPPL